MKKWKEYKVECLDQSTFELLRTKVLKQRLKHLKRKPKKNEYGINRIKNELEARKLRKRLDEIERLALADDIDSMLEELDTAFSNSEFDDTVTSNTLQEVLGYENNEMELSSLWIDSSPSEPTEITEITEITEQSNSKTRQRIKEMKQSLADRLIEDPDFMEQLRVDSDKIKVVAELRYKSSNEIYGYLIQNISTCIVDLDYSETELEVLCPGDVTIVTLERFVRFTCKAEFSFTLANGTVRGTKHLDEVIKQEEETGLNVIYSNYHFVPASEEQSVPIILIDDIEWIVEDNFEMDYIDEGGEYLDDDSESDFDLEEKQRGQ